MDHELRRIVRFHRSADELWQLVADPSQWDRWLVDAVIDDDGVGAVVAGRRLLVEEQGDRRAVVIRSIDAGRSIEFAWATDDAAPSIVRLEVERLDDDVILAITERTTSPTTDASVEAWERRVLCLWAVCVAAALV
jgi:uncharacterized protein YndB with AHSA1/START domain